MRQKRLLVLSPHLDDGVLSCCDYSLEKQRLGWEVVIATIFTRFEKTLSGNSLAYMKKSGFSDVHAFEKKRIKEDGAALRFLKFRLLHFNFTDGGFRNKNKKPVYQNHSELFSGRTSPSDQVLQGKITRTIKNLQQDFDEILAPYGVGSHADHLIVKEAALQAVPAKNKLRYYVDFPYALKSGNWKLAFVKDFLFSQKKISPMSQKKQIALRYYSSQLPLLFDRKPQYSEVIMQLSV